MMLIKEEIRRLAFKTGQLNLYLCLCKADKCRLISELTQIRQMTDDIMESLKEQ